MHYLSFFHFYTWQVVCGSYRYNRTPEIWEPLLLEIFTIVCFAIASFSYFKVFRIIRRQQRQIQANQSSQCLRQSIITLKYKKSVSTILYILLLFLLCYSAYAIYINVNAMSTKAAAKSSILSWHVCATLVLMSSSLNPLSYCWRINEIRGRVNLMMKNVICKV